jgi:hypothetical protein
VARASHERLEPFDDRVAGKASPGKSEVRGGRAVQVPEAPDTLRAELLRLSVRLSDQSAELVPRGATLLEKTL